MTELSVEHYLKLLRLTSAQALLALVVQGKRHCTRYQGTFPAVNIKGRYWARLTPEMQTYIENPAHYQWMFDDLTRDFWDWAHERASDLDIAIGSAGSSSGWLVLKQEHADFVGAHTLVTQLRTEYQRLLDPKQLRLDEVLSDEDPFESLQQQLDDELDGIEALANLAGSWLILVPEVEEYIAGIPDDAYYWCESTMEAHPPEPEAAENNTDYLEELVAS